MAARALSASLGEGTVHACPDGHGVFLARADLGALVEAENTWHRHAAQHTSPMPRITSDMTAPPTGSPTGKAPAQAWVETLFD